MTFLDSTDTSFALDFNTFLEIITFDYLPLRKSTIRKRTFSRYCIFVCNTISAFSIGSFVRSYSASYFWLKWLFDQTITGISRNRYFLITYLSLLSFSNLLAKEDYSWDTFLLKSPPFPLLILLLMIYPSIV